MSAPIIRSTFLAPDPGPNNYDTLRWDQARVDANMREMLAVGIDSVILQWSADAAYGDCYYSGSKRWRSDWKLLDYLMNAAERMGVRVWLGLANDNRSQSNRRDRAWLKNNFEESRDTARELYARFGKSPAFAGWYFVHEIGAHWLSDDAALDPLKEWVDMHAAFLKSGEVGAKPVMCSPLFWEDGSYGLPRLGPVEHARRMKYVMGSLHVVNVQDGGGWGVMSDAVLAEYWTAMRDAFAGTGTQLWQNLEFFDFNSSGPASVDRLKARIGAVDPLVSGHSSWSFAAQMSTAAHPGDDRLFCGYRRYVSEFMFRDPVPVEVLPDSLTLDVGADGSLRLRKPE